MSSADLVELVVVGPQTTWPSDRYLSALRVKLVSNPRYAPLVATLDSLPTLWPALLQVHTQSEKLDENLSSLQALVDWIGGGTTVPIHSRPFNTILSPLTVVIHIVEYFEYLQQHPAVSHRDVLNASKHAGIQGLCTGLLAATVLACAKDESEIISLACNALRLAFYIGVFVDLQIELESKENPPRSVSIRWKSDDGKTTLMDMLQSCRSAYISVFSDIDSVTVTAPADAMQSLIDDLLTGGLVVKQIELSGLFHSSQHSEAVALMQDLCQLKPEFQLPSASSLLVPLRAGSNGQLLSEVDLHSFALRQILLEPSHWYQIIDRATNGLERHRVLQLGLVKCLPRSVILRKALNKQRVDLLTPHANDTAPDDLRWKPELHDRPEDSIAIVGMACKFAGSESCEEYWQTIAQGICCVSPVPDERFSPEGLHRQTGKNFMYWGNFVDGVKDFDHRFFGISPREAASTDPQQRILLQLAYQAVCASEMYDPESTAPKSKDVGCYLGVGAVDYESNIASHAPTAYSALGSLRAFLSGKLSHYFGWTGPSITFDTACSSSAVAIHSACKAILSGDCSSALAGGVNIITSPYLYQNLASASFLSSSGPSKAFDDRADGYCRGEGAGLVYLKKLSTALADGDNVLSVILSSTVNQSDNDTPITVPNTRSQIQLFNQALSASSLDPNQIGYVEAHGTGTPVGDPIECSSIRSVFGGPQRTTPLYLGSVKSNIGHTESASGVAALIKAVLMIQKRQIPPQATFKSLNLAIAPLDADRMAIATKLEPWNTEFMACCVNNYGAAGSNAAIVVCQPPALHHSIAGSSNPDLITTHPLIVTAHSLRSLQKYCLELEKTLKLYRGQLPERHIIASVAFHLSHQQDRDRAFRIAMTASSIDQLSHHLRKAISNTESNGDAAYTPKRSVVLLFGGQNDHYFVDRSTYYACHSLQKYLNICNRACLDLGQPDLFPAIFGDTKAQSLAHQHCMLFSLQYACALTWMAAGLKPEVILGHSFGQITAICVSGCMSLENALALVSERARLIAQFQEPGAGLMVAVEGSFEALQRILTAANAGTHDNKLEIACYNGPTSHVISGSTTSIQVFEGLATSATYTDLVKIQRLESSYAYHSPLIDPIMSDLHSFTEKTAFSQPSIPLETCSPNQSWSLVDSFNVAEQSRTPVFFSDAVQRIARRLGPCAWLEAGSGSPVINMARRALNTDDSGKHAFQSIKLEGPESIKSLADATCHLWRAGISTQFWPYQRLQRHQFCELALPPYQFDTSSHWLEYGEKLEEPRLQAGESPSPERPLLSPSAESDARSGIYGYDVNISQPMYQACVRGHAVLGKTLCPASTYLELAYQAVSLSPPADVLCVDYTIENLEIMAPLGLRTGVALKIILTKIQKRPGWEFVIVTTRPESTSRIQHAKGMVLCSTRSQITGSESLISLQRLIQISRPNGILNNDDSDCIQGIGPIYQSFDRVVSYKEYYRGLHKVSALGNECAGKIVLPLSSQELTEDACSDPIAMDCYLQVAGLHINSLRTCSKDEVFICAGLESFQRSSTETTSSDISSNPTSWTVYAIVQERSARELLSDILVFEATSGRLCVAIRGVLFKSIPLASLATALAKVNAPDDKTIIPRYPMASFSEGQAQSPTSRSVTTALSNDDSSVPVSRASIDDVQSRAEISSILEELTTASIDAIAQDTPFEDLGIDSLMLIELQHEIQRKFGVTVSVPDIQATANLTGLCHIVNSRITTADPGGIYTRHVQTTPPSSANSTFEDDSPFTGATSSVCDIVHNLLYSSSDNHKGSSPLRVTSRLGDIGIDSLMMIELHSDLEKAFNTTIDIKRLTEDLTLGALTSLIVPRRRDSFQPDASLAEFDSVRDYSTKTLSSISASGPEVEARAFSQHAFQTFDVARSRYDNFINAGGFAQFQRNVYPRQTALVISYINEAFDQLGCRLRDLREGEYLPKLEHLPEHNRAMCQYYAALEQMSLIKRAGQGWCRTEQPVPTESSISLSDDIIQSFPQHASEHRLLRITGAPLAECLSGREDALQLLFGDQKAKDLLEDVYTCAPMFATATSFVVSFLTQVLSVRKMNRPIRLLEIGGGTGGTTKAVVPVLARLGGDIQCSYTFSDISPSLVAAAKRKFAGYDFMNFVTLDVESNPPAQMRSNFDIVLSSNCIHATTNLTQSCTNVRSMLNDTGLLCLVELTRNLQWFDLVFGLLKGWWLFEDGRNHALAHESFWEHSLYKAGFGTVRWTEGDTEESNQLRVIVAFAANHESSEGRRSASQGYYQQAAN